ncbi:GGDEF domain-containing protein [Variovorax saccharolyticus]|uniref:GGDEF domain-containing protein n=1 Tax=Variovorax saccharolyticus TaxID=3053516 RepID=UPI002577AE84|nr:GGDEF domain-containing protein [Variovorax sp. J31P216]MDM0030183.1 GGDEF domain-containing protein [Variovorax sp. J31P216]
MSETLPFGCRLRAHIAARYLRTARWFIPSQFDEIPLAFSRAQNVICAAVIAGIADPFYAYFYYLLGFGAVSPAILFFGIFMVGAPLLLKVTGSLKLAEGVFVMAVYCNFTLLTYRLGGIEAPTAPWLILCPVVAMFLGGALTGIFWLVMSCLATLGIYLLQINGAMMPANRVSNPLALYLACSLGLFVVVVVFVLFFEIIKNQGFVRLEKALRTIQELAIRDELTGTFNRRHLLELIGTERSRATESLPFFCVCLLDIDHFKKINDTYGHQAGDTVLTAFACAVERAIRSSDCFGRYGGEEFVLMMPQTDLRNALTMADRVRRTIEEIVFPGLPEGFRVTVSIGVAQYEPSEEVSAVLERADQALYVAKVSGRNRVVRYLENLRDADEESPRTTTDPQPGVRAAPVMPTKEHSTSLAGACSDNDPAPHRSIGGSHRAAKT